jgi:hypothetical protein
MPFIWTATAWPILRVGVLTFEDFVTRKQFHVPCPRKGILGQGKGEGSVQRNIR